MQLLTLIVCIAAVVTVVLPEPSVATPSPIVLIPGMMGSQLNVVDHGKDCNTKLKEKKLWVSLRLLRKNCALRELSLKYDPNTRSFANNTDVEITVPGFGNASSVEFLGLRLLKYFNEMVEYFVNRDYQRDETIRAAPYDWRLAADELEKRGYYHQLKSLIEETYHNNSRTKVTLVVHSMGGLVSLHFLTGFGGIDQAWKDKYIHAYITLSAAWSGGAASLHTVISGTHGTPQILRRSISRFIASLARTLESIPWLFPRSSMFGNAVLVSTPSKNYTANDYADLFSKIGYTNGYSFFQGVQDLFPNYPAPNVPTYCFYGVKEETPKKFTYKKSFDQYTDIIGKYPQVSYGDGDGTVNIESSRVCHRWSSMPSKYPFSHETFDNVNHMQIVKNENVLKKIAKIVGAPNRTKSSRKLLSFFKG